MKRKFLELSDGSLLALDRLVYAKVENGLLCELAFDVGDPKALVIPVRRKAAGFEEFLMKSEVSDRIKTFDL